MPTKTKTKQTLDIKSVDTPSDLVTVNDAKSVYPDQVLSKAEVTALEYHENVIEKGLETFIEVGQSLQYIRDNRLYRAEYKSFKEYIEQRWHFQVRQAHRIITGIETTQLLTDAGVPGDTLPNSEKVARPLAKLKDDPELMAEVWEEAVAEAKKQFEAGLKKTDQPTHKEVEAKVKEYEAQIEALKNKQTSLLNDLNDAKTTIENQNKDIQEKNSELSQLKAKEKDLKDKEDNLNRLINSKVDEKVKEETEKELDKINKEKAELAKKTEQITKELKEAEKLKKKVEENKKRFDDTTQWITAFALTNNFLGDTVHKLREHRNDLQNTPDLSKLSEEDQKAFKAKIDNLIVEFNSALHELGGQINYLNGAVARFNNHALRVIEAEVADE